MSNHYVYLLQHRTTGMCYIGVRSCKCTVWDDDYMGSSSVMTEEDKDECNKIVLKRFDSREDAVAYEVEMHEKFDVAKNPLFWNRAKQTSTGFDTSGRVQPEEERKARSKALMGHKGAKTWLGKKLPEATKKKMSEAAKGVPKSEAHKQALKEAHKKRKYKGFDTTIYTFVHKDKGSFTGTQHEFYNTYKEVQKSNLNKLIKGTYKTHKGWRLHE